MFKFHDYWSTCWKLSKHRSLEIQLMRDSTLISFEIDLSYKGHSHAGPRFSIALFFHRLTIELPDSRHWNYEADRWETQQEQEEWTKMWYAKKDRDHATQ